MKSEKDIPNNNETLKSNIAALYSRAAPGYGQIGPGKYVHVGQGLVERLGIGEGAQVLDVAAGRGANLFPAAEKAGLSGRVTGIDLSEGMVQETTHEIKRRNVQNATVMQMDAEHFIFNDASFDFITCGFAIFLFPNLEQVLAEFHRVLRPGGKLGISVARNPDPLSQWYGQHISDYAARYHLPLRVGGNNLDYAELPSLLAHAGFTDVQVLREQTTFVYAGPQEWWDEKWTHGTRYSLEHMPSDVLAQFQSEVFAHLAQEQQAGGIREEWHIQYCIGTR